MSVMVPQATRLFIQQFVKANNKNKIKAPLCFPFFGGWRGVVGVGGWCVCGCVYGQ